MEIQSSDSHNASIFGASIVQFKGPILNDECLFALHSGINMHLTIIHRPFAGNIMYLYDENLREVKDDYFLFHAKRIIYTNYKLGINDNIEGFVLLDMTVTMQGSPTERNNLYIDSSTISHTIKDEYSLLLFKDIKIGDSLNVHLC